MEQTKITVEITINSDCGQTELANHVEATLKKNAELIGKYITVIPIKAAIQTVDKSDSGRYPMCEDQNVQLDCRNLDCDYHCKGECTNVSPAITMVKEHVVCWSKACN